MKQDINWYMNRAKELHGLKSDRQLATRLHMANVAKWRHPDRPDVPSVAAMIKLASLANVPADMALLHRDLWEAEFKTPEAVPIFKKLLKSLPQYAAGVILGCNLSLGSIDFDGSGSAFAGEKNGAQVTTQFILW
ncbi:hypothetical protein [Paremcibacter congregatus]|uniref:Uncharacterized protein n=1 Tax=Paremcibacter congregatus TaxID=2043170 RepID=A0A2G4YVJ2_9PROT|nr:hypothetical protein [Paremcibacter congregatus]PHZ86293.1 hypothetical protein CRD36_06405 [Paremcibacter congregatus]QDE27260.1 hypothetical protein FIV45_08170 [Paremcibacter congregatus]